jgi:hypothetical protein
MASPSSLTIVLTMSIFFPSCLRHDIQGSHPSISATLPKRGLMRRWPLLSSIFQPPLPLSGIESAHLTIFKKGIVALWPEQLVNEKNAVEKNYCQ